jgi:hypothetical protein
MLSSAATCRYSWRDLVMASAVGSGQRHTTGNAQNS